MKITIIGSGCPKCECLYNRVKKMKEDGKTKAEIEYLKGVDELIKRGVMGSPAILVDDKVVFVGVPDDKKLEEITKK